MWLVVLVCLFFGVCQVEVSGQIDDLGFGVQQFVSQCVCYVVWCGEEYYVVGVEVLYVWYVELQVVIMILQVWVYVGDFYFCFGM